MRIFGFFLLSVLAAFSGFLAWAAFPYNTGGLKTDQILNSIPERIEKDTIRVLTWNIAYAQGSGSDGSAYAPLSAGQMQVRLKKIAGLIDSLGADIALLQEVDFASNRSYYTDQLKFLRENTMLKNAAASVSWRANHVPFPFWPLKNQWGRMESGAGVLSRFEIRLSQSFFYEKPSERSFLYNFFYPYRFRQTVDIQVNRRVFQVINNHLEAFKPESRMQQARELMKYVETAGENVILYGGDFNSLPAADAGRAVQKHFDSDVYELDSTLAILSGNDGYRESVPDSLYLSNPDRWFTFPAKAPNRRLDYLFFQAGVKILDVKVIQTGELSDHLPVFAVILLPK